MAGSLPDNGKPGFVLRLASQTFLAGLILSILVGLLLPVYTDEVGWRLQLRAAVDGFDKMYSDNCGANTLAVPPLFMMPVRHYSALFNGLFPDPFFVRLSGVAYALALVALLVVLVRRVASDAVANHLLAAICFGLLGLGMLPLLLVWSRPEQPVVLAMVGALVLSAKGWNEAEAPSRKAMVLRCGAILVLSAIALSYHLKAVALLPVFALCLLFCAKGRTSLGPRLAATGILVLIGAVAAQYWIGRFKCPGDPVLALKYSQHNISALLTKGASIPDAIAAAASNFGLDAYFRLAAPTNFPMSSWVPERLLSPGTWWWWRLALSAAWELFLVAGMVCLVTNAIRVLRTRSFDPRIPISLTLLLVALVWTASQTVRNPYDTSFILPIVAVAIVLAISAIPAWEKWRVWPFLLLPLCLASATGQIVVAATYLPSLIETAHHRGYLPRQPLSQPLFGYPAARRQIEAAAGLCRIGELNRTRSLMIDDVTYFAMIGSHRPQHQIGVVGEWRGQIADPGAYLRSVGSDGAILGCHYLDEPLRSKAKRVGQFCCLAPSDW